MGRAAAADEREQRVKVHRAVVRDGLGERGVEARRAQAPSAPRRDVVVMDLSGAVGHRTGLCVGTPRVLTCESHAPMQPLASTAREARVLAQSQLGIAFFFAIAAALLNPLEMAIGVVLGTPSVFALAYFALLRRLPRGRISRAPPAPPPAPPRRRPTRAGSTARSRVASCGRWRPRSPCCCSSPASGTHPA